MAENNGLRLLDKFSAPRVAADQTNGHFFRRTNATPQSFCTGFLDHLHDTNLLKDYNLDLRQLRRFVFRKPPRRRVQRDCAPRVLPHRVLRRPVPEPCCKWTASGVLPAL